MNCRSDSPGIPAAVAVFHMSLRCMSVRCGCAMGSYLFFFRLVCVCLIWRVSRALLSGLQADFWQGDGILNFGHVVCFRKKINLFISAAQQSNNNQTKSKYAAHYVLHSNSGQFRTRLFLFCYDTFIFLELEIFQTPSSSGRTGSLAPAPGPEPPVTSCRQAFLKSLVESAVPECDERVSTPVDDESLTRVIPGSPPGAPLKPRVKPGACRSSSTSPPPSKRVAFSPGEAGAACAETQQDPSPSPPLVTPDRESQDDASLSPDRRTPREDTPVSVDNA